MQEVPSASLALRAACADPGGLGPLAPFLYRLCDTAVAVGVLCAAFVLSNLGPKPMRFSEFLAMRLSVKNLLLLIGFALVWRATCTLCGLYEWRRIASPKGEGARILLACALGSMAAIAFPLTSVSGAFTYQTLLLFAIGTSLGMAALRGTLRIVVAARPKPAKSILMVGSGRLAAEVIERLRADPDVVYHLAGFVDSDIQSTWLEVEPPHVGQLEELESLLMHSAIDEVVVALPVKSYYSEIQRVVEICERLGVAVTLPAQPFRASRAAVRLRQSPTLPAVTLEHGPAGVRLVIKRIIDVLGAALGIILLAPVMLLAAAAIKLTSPGPILFSQERYGYNRRVFRMYKFRTMVADAEARQAELEHLNEASGPLFKIRYDPRVTGVGRVLRRTSVDELPQLFNVMCGDMSLVGPRPMAIRDVYQFPESWLMRRFSVRPGITGLWQVRGRSQLDYEAWADLDLKYIDEWSLARDLGILLLTVPAVLTGRGAQ
ncbi:MAG TPA: sugar transferase [Gemmatimonadales bacterium]|nr:sugar transferase [Gemmatimonadales bacterium]